MISPCCPCYRLTGVYKYPFTPSWALSKCGESLNVEAVARNEKMERVFEKGNTLTHKVTTLDS